MNWMISMVRMVCVVLMVTALVILGSPGSVFADENLPPGYGGAEILEGSVVDITGINAVNYPSVVTYVLVHTPEGEDGLLTEDDITVIEDGKPVIVNDLSFSSPATPTKMDLAIVFDDTGSLDDEIEDMKEKVRELTAAIASSQIDCRYSLVSFKDTVTVRQEWTSDPDAIARAVDGLEASGGDDAPEADLDAIEAVLEMGFRPEAQHMIVDITDEKTHYRDDGTSWSQYTIPETAGHLLSNGVSYILIGPATVSGSFTIHDDKRELVKALGGSGLFFDIHRDDFRIILDKIQSVITRTYTIRFTSQTPGEVGRIGTVKILVGSDSDTGQYIARYSDQTMISGLEAEGQATPCNPVPVVISGQNFIDDSTVRVVSDSTTIDLTNLLITPGSISGLLTIPCDAPAGAYLIEVISPDGRTTTGPVAWTITPGEPVVLPSDEDTGSEGIVPADLSSRWAGGECVGWEDDSGYYLVGRDQDISSPEERIPNPWCWCNGFPYNRNYQTCVPMPSS